MHTIATTQRQFFNTHVTREVKYRREALKKLRTALKEWEPRIAEALQKDLGKCGTETFMTEIGMVLSSLNHTLSCLRSWSKPRRTHTPLAQFPSVSRVVPEPYGVALIMSPWNYPVLLCLDPLVAALSAGNCCVVKPSSMTPATSAVLAEMLGSIYPKEYVHVVLGGRESTGVLLEQKFDYIFFTGSPNVGHIIMEAAARHLTPVTLELGGKSPCIVDATANIRVAARRIAFGKILNAGQTCVAPDYLFIHHSVKDAFVEEYRATEDAMRSTLLTAQRMAAQMVQEAQTEKDKLLAAAREEVAAQVGHYDEARAVAEQKLALAQKELAAFISRSKELCVAQAEFLAKLPELELVQQEPVCEDTIRLIGQDIVRSFAREAEEPVVEETDEPVAEEEVPEQVEMVEEITPSAMFPTRLDELKFGRNYTGE